MKRYVAIAFIFGLSFLLFACSKNVSSKKNGTITIVYSGNIGAEIDVCGCRIPKGGLAKRATFIGQIRQKDPNALILDSGALLYERNKISTPMKENLLRRAALTLDVVKEIGIDAANIGSMDMADSPDSLLALKERGLPWLSSNIVWKNSGALLFPPDTVKTVGNLQVGIFGFMNPNTLGVPFFDANSPVEILDPKSAVQKEISKLRKKSDVVIGLAYMDLDDIKKLLQEIPEGPDVLIVSHTLAHSQETEPGFYIPLKIGKTLIVRCPDGGRVLGVLNLKMQNGITDFVDVNLTKDLRPEAVKKSNPNQKIVSTWTNSFTDLDYQIPRDKAIQARVDSVVKLNEEFQKKYAQ
jgi:2',3'-cyclic-nucleotide 2'-phosphodiesterase (5'-nucleotidase family)